MSTREWSARGGADRCDDMHCATTSGIGSKTFCRAVKAMWRHGGGQSSVRRSRSLQVSRRSRGVICPSALATDRLSAFQPMAKAAFSSGFQALGQRSRQRYMMIDATIVRAHQHSAAPKRRCASHRPIPRRIDHQDTRARRCPRQSCRGDAQPGPGSRSDSLISHRSRRSRRSDRRQASTPMPSSAPSTHERSSQSSHPNPTEDPAPVRLRPLLRRNLIERFFNKLKHSGHRHALRQARQDFPRRVHSPVPPSSSTGQPFSVGFLLCFIASAAKSDNSVVGMSIFECLHPRSG